MARQQKALIEMAMARLPYKERTAFILRDFEGLSTEEVATRLGISTAAVRLRLFRAHGRMKKGASSVAKDGRLGRRAAGRRSRTSRDFSLRNEVRVLLQYGGNTGCARGS